MTLFFKQPKKLFLKVSQRKRMNLNQPPGTLSSAPEAHPTSMSLWSYDEKTTDEQKVESIEDVASLINDGRVHWLHVTGLRNVELLREIGALFELHPLALEDVQSIPQRSKQEDYSTHIYTVCQIFHKKEDALEMEQLSFFLCDNVVITFEEHPGDCFESVRTRLRMNRGRIRTKRHDYLFYALLDAVVDHYFPLLEHQGALLDDMEQTLFETTSKDANLLPQLMGLRRTLWSMRRVLWPLRDTIAHLAREPHELIDEEVRLYFRDCHDHTLRLIDLVENYREINTHLKDVSLNIASHRLNEVMKVLTIISTIFIPLSFLAGLYGMNFDQASPYNLPELRSPYGYPILLLVMAIIAIVLLGYFVKKGWIGSRS